MLLLAELVNDRQFIRLDERDRHFAINGRHKSSHIPAIFLRSAHPGLLFQFPGRPDRVLRWVDHDVVDGSFLESAVSF